MGVAVAWRGNTCRHLIDEQTEDARHEIGHVAAGKENDREAGGVEAGGKAEQWTPVRLGVADDAHGRR